MKMLGRILQYRSIRLLICTLDEFYRLINSVNLLWLLRYYKQYHFDICDGLAQNPFMPNLETVVFCFH